MRLALKLAYKNLVGAGLRTWLNVSVLAFAFMMILFFNGLTSGWSHQAERDGVEWEFGQGELQAPGFDPYDPFSFADGHGTLKSDQIDKLTPILVRQASIYPKGRIQSVTLKGIPTDQQTLKLPTGSMRSDSAGIAVMMGERMARSIQAKEGDHVLMRWRDKHGTFDATDVTIAHIFNTQVPTVDEGIIWIPLDTLWAMTGLQGQASLYVAKPGFDPAQSGGWTFLSQHDLLKDIRAIIDSERFSDAFIYLMLLAIALIAIFDTQVLSVFRRQREIGTYIALGMTRPQVVRIFTVEGSMYSLLAVVVGCIIALPLFGYVAHIGIGLPESIQGMGMMLSKRLYPYFSTALVVGTVALVVVSATIVSWLPARKIARMDPVEALKGKLQ